MSQRQLAKIIEMNPSQFSKVERNLVDPRISTIEKICSGLGITLYDFFIVYKSSTTNTSLVSKLSMFEKLSREEKDSIFDLMEKLIKKN